MIFKLVIELTGITSSYFQSLRISIDNNQEIQLALLKEIKVHTLPWLGRPFRRVDNNNNGALEGTYPRQHKHDIAEPSQQ